MIYTPSYKWWCDLLLLIMMTMENLSELFVGGIRDIYYAEKAISKELPKMAKNSTNEDLKTAFENHLEETEGQIERLEQVFKILGLEARWKKCHAIDWILEEGKELMDESKNPEIMDAALNTAAHKVEHYEIWSYRTLIAQAEVLWHDDIVGLLQETLEEEEDADATLEEIETELFETAL